MTSDRMRDFQEQWANEGPPGQDLKSLSCHAGLSVARLSASDLLLDVDGGATLGAAKAAAAANAVHFPPIPASSDTSMALICAAWPIFVEGFVSHIDATDTHGRTLATPQAPRSAQGPDLMGALLTSPPLAVCVRARVRCATTSTMDRFVIQAASPRFAAAALMVIMREGRAYSALACGTKVEVVAKELPRSLRAMQLDPNDQMIVNATAASAMLGPFDVEHAASTLEAGETIVAAPQMGRLSQTVAPSALPLIGGASAAAHARNAMLAAAKRTSRW